jgi:putative oxidoreductase
MFKKLIATKDDRAALVLRVMLGLVFFPHGAQKLLGWFGGYGFSGTMGFFTGQLEIPAMFAFLAIIAEFFGALGLLAGLFTRVAALGIMSVMLVAVPMLHAKHGFFMNWSGSQAGEGFEYHLLVIAMAVALIIRGGGTWSADKALADKSN